jgi:hypothetical protein
VVWLPVPGVLPVAVWKLEWPTVNAKVPLVVEPEKPVSASAMTFWTSTVTVAAGLTTRTPSPVEPGPWAMIVALRTTAVPEPVPWMKMPPLKSPPFAISRLSRSVNAVPGRSESAGSPSFLVSTSSTRVKVEPAPGAKTVPSTELELVAVRAQLRRGL